MEKRIWIADDEYGLLERIARDNEDETYLYQDGGDFRQYRFYYIRNMFIMGDCDFIGMDHDGPLYYKIPFEYFLERFKEFKEENKNNEAVQSTISYIEKVINDHKDYLYDEEQERKQKLILKNNQNNNLKSENNK